LKQTRKVAIGQLIMGGRGHLVGIKPGESYFSPNYVRGAPFAARATCG
jgi:hypothetical protein